MQRRIDSQMTRVKRIFTNNILRRINSHMTPVKRIVTDNIFVKNR